MTDPLAVTVISTAPIQGQQPGTSGLRKKTKVFMQGHYLANFVQATFSALLAEGAPVQGKYPPPHLNLQAKQIHVLLLASLSGGSPPTPHRPYHRPSKSGSTVRG
jgi:hypothetical protein